MGNKDQIKDASSLLGVLMWPQQQWPSLQVTANILYAASVKSESSGLGQYLSVLKGTGALAGRRDRQDRQHLGSWTLTAETTD